MSAQYPARVEQRRRRLLVYGLVTALAVSVCSGVGGIGVWLLHGATGCSAVRPNGITADDLYGTYRATDGGRLTLGRRGAITTSKLRTNAEVGLAKPDIDGSWQLLDPPPENDADILVTTQENLFYIGVAGARRHPWLYLGRDSGDRCGLYRLTRS